MLFISSNLLHIQITKMKSSVTQNRRSYGREWKGECWHAWLLGLKLPFFPRAVNSLQRHAQPSVDLLILSKYFLHSWITQWCAQTLLRITDFYSEQRGLQNALRFQTKWRFTLWFSRALYSRVQLIPGKCQHPQNKDVKPLKVEIRLKATGRYFFFPT